MATKKILKYPETSMVQALDAVRNGMPVRTAAKQFKVPKTTLLYKFNGKHPVQRKMGPETILKKQEKVLIVKWVQDMAKAGFPVSKENFLNSVTKLSNELNKPFRNSKPGRKWYENFLKRHAEISLRTPQNLTKSRCSVKKQHLSKWFQEVYEYLSEQDCKEILDNAQRIFNADESAFFLNPKGNKVLAPRGDKNVYGTKEYFVSAMTPSGPSGWKWPEIKDEIWYNKENVVEVISPPTVTNSRGVCVVKEIEKFK